jgi:hypothetical protein
VFWFWIFVGPALLLAIASLRGERRRAEYVTARMAELDSPPAGPLPSVTVILPPSAAPETRVAVAAQDYPDYEMIAQRQPPRTGSRILVFAPSSGVVAKQWVRALVAPLSDRNVDMSTGFRWYAPDPPTFWSLARSVWNGVIAGRLGPGVSQFAWRGAMAVRTGSAAATRVAFAPGAVVVDSTCTTMLAFLRQASEEMAAVRKRYPRLWLQALLAHIIYCGAMLAAAIASYRGYRGAEWVLVAQFGLGMLKGANRATLAKAQMPQLAGWFDRYSWTHIVWVPFVTWIWLYALATSVFVSEPAEGVS